MSLIRVRRKRKKDWIDVKKGGSTRLLTYLLILCVIAFWVLTVRY